MDDLHLMARILLSQEELALIDLWILYWNHGGDCHPFDFDAFIHDMLPFAGFDLNAGTPAWAPSG
jgi:hypothetical protein